MKAIYKFYADCGRMGDLEGVFVCEQNEIENLYGEEVNFGEVLGKHSEVSLTMSDKYFTEVTTDEKFIELFETYNLETGFNPLDYVDDYDEEEDED